MTKSTHSPATMRQTTDINHPDTVVAARYQSAIGVDVHASILVCAYQDGTHPESIKTEHLSFGTKYSEIEAFAQWCKQRNPDVIVMESTGVLWRSAYEALEKVGFTSKQLAFVNARDVKAIIGRKTDREDAQRLAEIARLGNIKKSFIPPRVFREMRQLSRRYQGISQKIASQTNVYHKLLNATGCRAGSVFSDVKGVAATAILEAKLAGVEDLDNIVSQYGRRLKATRSEIVDALNFEIHPSIRQQLIEEREQIQIQKQFAQRTFDRLKELQAPYEHQIELLMSIPGIKEVSARLIFAELADDLAQYFPDAEHFSSWLGICPGNKISATKNYSGSPSKGNKWLRRTLVECAQGISLSKLPLRERFMVWKLRRGTLRAIVAVAHLLARIIFSILKNQTMFQLMPMTTQRDEVVNRIKKNISKLKRMNCVLQNTRLVERDTGEIISNIV